MAITCPYCQQPAIQVGGAAIYPHRPDLAAKQFWQCAPCGAYVGCHPAGPGRPGNVPMGRLANAELRRAKSAAHAAFDPLWRQGGMPRRDAYKWLAQALRMRRQDCHIGMFDVAHCAAVIAAVQARAAAETLAASVLITTTSPHCAGHARPLSAEKRA